MILCGWFFSSVLWCLLGPSLLERSERGSFTSRDGEEKGEEFDGFGLG